MKEENMTFAQFIRRKRLESPEELTLKGIAENEDYGAFSSSCPGYGKHHSGDVEAAFSKPISCSLSSKGCKHR